jgi:hypothetical protein
MTSCVVCTTRTHTALCRGCLAAIEHTLAETPADWTDLTAVATRQATGPLGLGDNRNGRQWDGPLSTGALGDAPWVYAPGAADQLWAMENTLVTWARHIAETNRLELPDTRRPQFTTTTTTRLTIRHNRMRMYVHVEHHEQSTPTEPSAILAARFLHANLRLIAIDQAAFEIHDELTALAEENQRWSLGGSIPTLFAGKCDAPDVRVIAIRIEGPLCDPFTCTHPSCDEIRERPQRLWPRVSTCGADLYAHEGDDDVKCHACGRTYPLAKRRAAILEKLNDEWCRAQLIANALTTNDEPINASTLRSWILRDSKLSKARRATIDRPLILQVGIDDDGQPLYLVSDVRARIAWSRERAKSERLSA